MAKLIEVLDEIQGDGGTTYWYTPHVMRTHAADDARVVLDKYEAIYVLAPFEVEITEQNGGQHEQTVVVDFLLLRRHQLPDEPHHASTPLRWTVQHRLLGDFLQKILEDPTLDGTCSNIGIRQVVLSAEETYEPGFAIVKGQIAPTHSLDGASIAA